LRIVCEALGQDLEGNIAAETGVARAKDFTHPSRSEGSEDLVWPKAVASGEPHTL